MPSTLQDWDNTDEDEIQIPVRHVPSSTPKPDPAMQEIPTVPRGQRKTAAITGIIVVLIIGLLVFGGIGGLLGQLVTPDFDISILDNRVEPPISTVAIDQRVRFTNNSGIPQIIAADNENGEILELESPIILPEDYYDWIVPKNVNQGTYTFASKTNDQITGTIIVGLETAPVVTTSTTNSVASVPSNESVIQESIQQEEPAAPVPQGSIPVNPHAINGSVTTTTPTPAATAQTNTYVAANAEASVTSHTPIMNAESGIGIWTLAIVGLIAFAGLLRMVAKL